MFVCGVSVCMFQSCSLIKGASLTSPLGPLKDISPLEKTFQFQLLPGIDLSDHSNIFSHNQILFVQLGKFISGEFSLSICLSPCLLTHTYSIDSGSYYLYHMWICCRVSGDRWCGCQTLGSLFILYSEKVFSGVLCCISGVLNRWSAVVLQGVHQLLSELRKEKYSVKLNQSLNGTVTLNGR